MYKILIAATLFLIAQLSHALPENGAVAYCQSIDTGEDFSLVQDADGSILFKAQFGHWVTKNMNKKLAYSKVKEGENCIAHFAWSYQDSRVSEHVKLKFQSSLQKYEISDFIVNGSWMMQARMNERYRRKDIQPGQPVPIPLKCSLNQEFEKDLSSCE